MRQLEAFLAAADAEKREHLVELLTVVCVGTHGGRDAVKRVLKDLQRAD